MDLTAHTLHGLPDQIHTTLFLSNQMIAEWCQNVHLIQLARYVVRGCDGMAAESEQVRAWVRENIEYRNDPAGHELIQDPIVTLSERAGDCDDMSILAGSLLACIGHECEAAAVTWEGNDFPSHEVIFDKSTSLFIDPVASCPAANWPPSPYVVKEIKGA